MINRKKKVCKSCHNEHYLFGKGLCKACYDRATYKPLSRTQKAIKKVSKNQKEKLKTYKIERNAYLELHPMCEVCELQHSTEIHHKKGRDGENLLNHFLACCSSCHKEIELNPIKAKEMGYSLTRLN